jgi:hypothetical protein
MVTEQLRRQSMTLVRAQALIDGYETNTWLIHRHVDDISDDESLLQLPFEANCLNWIVGHIVHRRNSSLEALGVPPLWSAEISARYKSGSPPIKSQDDARRFGDLLADLDESQRALVAALQVATDATLDQVVENDRGAMPAIEHLQGFHWHETYHIGQLDILQAFIASTR